MMAATSCPSSECLQEHLACTLAAGAEADVTTHLDACAACQQTLELLANPGPLLTVARQVGQDPPNPVPRLQEVLRKLAGDDSIAESGMNEADWPVGAAHGLWPPKSVGPYEIQKVLGRGGMGIVLLANDPGLRRLVAVKVLAPVLAADEFAHARFLREARAAAAVRHEHVIGIHGVAEANGLPYLVMEYFPGESLQDRLDREGPLAVADIVRIGRDVAEGLAAAHARGLVHRDVKPANILLGEGNSLKITDFGLAIGAHDDRTTSAGTVAGTPQFMSPEQATGAALGPQSDLFSLGSLLYTLCTGDPPFRSDTALATLRQVAEVTPPPVRTVNPSIPEWLAAIIARLHVKDPSQRIQSAATLAELLARCERPPEPRRSLRRRRFTIAAAVFLVIVSALGTGKLVTTALGQPDLMVRHEASNDPTTEGFVPNQLGAVSAGPLTDDPAPGAWRVSTAHPVGQSFYTRSLSASQEAMLTSHGFTLTMVSRSPQDTTLGCWFAEVEYGGRRFDIDLNRTVNGDTVVTLATSIVMESDGRYTVSGPNITIPGNQYHTYQLVASSQPTVSAELFVDGVRLFQGYQGHATFAHDRGLVFGAVSGGTGDFVLVELVGRPIRN
jgi:serine/threonine protein kinase